LVNSFLMVILCVCIIILLSQAFSNIWKFWDGFKCVYLQNTYI
jgi:SNF family Na+-dependent transporter